MKKDRERNSPRKDRLRTIENLRFECNRLGRAAALVVEREYCTHEDPADTHSEGVRFRDCANKFDCGLYVGDPRGVYKVTEDLSVGCDAQKKLNETGDI